MLPRVQLPDDQYLAYSYRRPEDPATGSDAPTLLFLHGGGVDHRMWQPQLDAFPTCRRIALDARAHGQSSTPTKPYRLVDDVVAVLDALDLDRVVVVGLSMGGGTAVDLAVERPDRVEALVVSGTGTSAPDFRDPWVLETFGMWQTAVEQQDPEMWIEAFHRFLPGPHRRLEDVDPEVLRTNDVMVRETLDTHVLPVFASGSVPVEPTPIDDVNARRSEISAPVLTITGALDSNDNHRLARELLDSVTDGREVVVPGTAHYPNLERPDVFNEAVAHVLGHRIAVT